MSSEEYYPFGETSFGSYGKKRYRFCGKEKDEESGLYYFEARYYNAWTCRFITIDPLTGKHPDKTPYHYCSNNPINRVDLSGMADGPTGGGKSKANKTTNNTKIDLSKIHAKIQGNLNEMGSDTKNRVQSDKNKEFNDPNNLQATKTIQAKEPNIAGQIKAAINSPAAKVIDPIGLSKIAYEAADAAYIVATQVGSKLGLSNAAGGQHMDGEIASQQEREGAMINTALIALPAPKGVGMIDDALKAGNTETFYRTMPYQHYDDLAISNSLSATSETMISPTKAFAENYKGALVEFKVTKGTQEALAAVGVRDGSKIATSTYPGMSKVSTGWNSTNAYFKGETLGETEIQQLNIGLGKGDALGIFNKNIRSYKILR